MIIGFTASREAPTERRRACRETRKPKRSIGEPIAKRETPNEASESLPRSANPPTERRRSFRRSRLPFWQVGERFAARENQNEAPESLPRDAKAQTERRRAHREPRLSFWQPVEAFARRGGINLINCAPPFRSARHSSPSRGCRSYPYRKRRSAYCSPCTWS